MQLLTFTNLYPSRQHPRRGVFVEERLRHIVATRAAVARVLALRPGLPGGGPVTETPEVRHGIPVEYCRVPTLPLVSNWIDPLLWARAAEPAARRMVSVQGKDTIVDAHFLYPDGVAAVLVAERLQLPVVMTARGSDVNVKCENRVMRAWIRWAAERCSALITVSSALADRLEHLRIRSPITVLRNGVDTELFRIQDRAKCRLRLGLTASAGHRLLVSVGHLVPEKGHDIAIDVVADMPGVLLAIVGDGPERCRLDERARRRGVTDRVRFLGLIAHSEMPNVYAAADALVLASAREGMPNVVLESLACGTPVVATAVGGIGEVLTAPVAGTLVDERTPKAFAAALRHILDAGIPRTDTRAFAEKLGWRPVVERQVALYREVLLQRGIAPARLEASS